MSEIEFMGKKYKSEGALCDAYEVKQGTFSYRKKHGYTIKESLGIDDSIPVLKMDGKEFHHIDEICKHFELDYEDFMKHKREGWRLKACLENVKQLNDTSSVKKEETKIEPVKEKIVEEKNEIDKKTKEEKVMCNASAAERGTVISTQMVSSVVQLINEIKEVNPTKIYFIDYENVVDQSELLSDLNNEGQMNVFFFNATLYSNDYYKLMRRLNKSVNYQVMTFEVVSQLVDHLITFYLGAVYSHLPEKDYTIVSRDRGYVPLVENLNCPNIKIKGIDLQDKAKYYKISLAKYIMDHANTYNSYTTNALQDLFKGFYAERGEELDRNNLQDLTKNLVRFKFMIRIDKGGMEFYKVNSTKVRESLT